jgi:formiminotetrahydrofolate cyclodeaminase
MANFPAGNHEPRLLPLIGQLAEGASGPAAGEVAGEVAALAAALCAAAADRSRDCWPEAAGVRAQALSLCRRALAVAERNAVAYAQARAALASRGAGAESSEARDHHLGTQVRLAAVPPLAIAEIAADVAHLAGEIADHGAPEHRADAVVAVRLAAAAASAAAHLVEVNLVAGADEKLPARARRHAAAAAACADRLA